MPSSARIEWKSLSNATESAPPETAIATRSPAESMPYFLIVCRMRPVSVQDISVKLQSSDDNSSEENLKFVRRVVGLVLRHLLG